MDTKCTATRLIILNLNLCQLLVFYCLVLFGFDLPATIPEMFAHTETNFEKLFTGQSV